MPRAHEVTPTLCRMEKYFVSYILIIIVALVNGSTPPYTTKYYEQYVDNFNFRNGNTFQMRYLVSGVHYDGNGVLLLYTGNEGPIEAFYENSGFVFELAEDFSALVIFVEHRYYGKSLPFGKDSFKLENIGYLSVDQALADYAKFCQSMMADEGIRKIVAVGGSYGGLLSAWMRFKYPNMVHGALAASAPMYIAANVSNPGGFFQVVTKDFELANSKCPKLVKEAYVAIESLANQGKKGLAQLTKSFKLCKPLTADKVEHLMGWIRNSFTSLAMVDYPYPASFLAPLPAYPVTVSCNYLLEASDVLVGIANAAGLFYNGTDGKLTCYDIEEEFIECADPTGCGTGPAATAWDYQACTDIPLFCLTNNDTDMFPPTDDLWKFKLEYCYKKYGVSQRKGWSTLDLWGKDIQFSSNIIFSNGDLDPWSSGGVLQNISDSLVAIVIEGGAHHLDLRGSHPDDLASVIRARNMEREIIKYWLNN